MTAAPRARLLAPQGSGIKAWVRRHQDQHARARRSGSRDTQALRSAFAKPLRRIKEDSKKIILVHNHPSGSLQPSAPDVEVTAHLYQVGELLDLPVVDHLIITEKGFYSFVDGGLMVELALTKKYLLNSAAQEKLKAQAEAQGREAVALAMKAEGIQDQRHREGHLGACNSRSRACFG